MSKQLFAIVLRILVAKLSQSCCNKPKIRMELTLSPFCFHDTQAKALINMMPMNTVAIAAGNIASMRQIYELGNYGYDGIVLGRNIAEVSAVL